MINKKMILRHLVESRNFLIYKWHDFRAKIRKKNFKLDPKANFVVSIASYPARSHLLPAVLESVGRQSVMPRYIYLVLSEEEWPKKKLPGYIVKLLKIGVEIVWTKNNPFSVKMLVPILEIQPNLGIVTLGDDWIYGRSFLENSVCSDAARKGKIAGPLGKALFRKGEKISMFYREKKNADLTTPSEQVYLLGLGTFYPPRSLDPKVSNLEAITRIVPGRGSDLWFWAAAKANGSEQICLGHETVEKSLIPIPENKETKPRDMPGKDALEKRFQMAIDFFGIREKLLESLPDRE